MKNMHLIFDLDTFHINSAYIVYIILQNYHQHENVCEAYRYIKSVSSI